MLSFSKVEKLLLTPEWHEKLKDQIPASAEIQLASMDDLREIVGFRLHQGVLALGKIPSPPETPPTGLIVALDGVADAENVGAILRTCAAFGVDGVIVGPDSCSPWTRRAVRVSLGASLKVPVYTSSHLVSTLQTLEGPIYAAHIHGERISIQDVDFTRPCCIVLGGEAKGVSDEVLKASTSTIYIPMAEGWDCLNVAASASALLMAAAGATTS